MRVRSWLRKRELLPALAFPRVGWRTGWPLRRLGRGLVAAFLLLLAVGCGPTFPSFWLIESDPQGPDGAIDPAGKLRVLGIQAEPPETGPDSTVRLSALVVTHPQHGLRLPGPQGLAPTAHPAGLTALWLACKQPSEVVAPEPCGLEQLNSTTELRRLTPLPATEPLPFPGEPLAAELRTSLAQDLPYTLLVTLIVADAAQPGGAEGCYAQAQQSRGVSPSVNHCLIAVKAVRVSSSDRRNHNPGITLLAFGPEGGSLATQPPQTEPFSYPRLTAATADSDRPKLTLAVERSPDSVEVGSDSAGQPRSESLSATFYTTAGTLEAGRGSFLDLDCASVPETCPQHPRTSVTWQPPTARADREAPEGAVHFFVVVRDDRGGLAFRRAVAYGR